MDRLTKKQRSDLMRKIKSKGTKPELKLHLILKKHGIKHRMWASLPGHPDIVLVKERIAIFVNGCFWHGCPKHYKEPKTNTPFWREKIRQNKARQRKSIRTLNKMGLKTRIIWEHDLR